ncbi:KRAB [Mytilus edulis]|uniref:KRAB n=1 Tax=Mytilus edulis TaxID=6550 RepID=A0A8S3UT96_MYTED|nr:KRAB [Mytilus edulis]
MNEVHYGIYGLEEELLPKITDNSKMSEEGAGQSSDMSMEGAGQSSDVKVHVISDTGKVHKYLYKFKGAKPYKCGVCDKAFNDQASVERHISSHTIRIVNPFSCTECGAEFEDKLLLEQHKLHAEFKHYKCKQSKRCRRSFHTKHGLVIHERTHRDKPFHCSICDTSYYSNILLKNHMANAHNETLYKCGLCKKVFTQHGLLRKHMKEHANDGNGKESCKVYKCDACQKDYSETSNLQALSMDIDNKDLKIYFCTDCMSKGINVHQMSNSKYAWK